MQHTICKKLTAVGFLIFKRDSQFLLGYDQWKNFQKVIEKAKIACQNSKLIIDDHFSEVGKVVWVGSGAKRKIDDVALTRHACYLIAQNGDPRKEEKSTLRVRNWSKLLAKKENSFSKKSSAKVLFCWLK